MAQTIQFEIDGQRFEVRRLEPEQACESVEIVGKALGPALLAVFDVPKDVLNSLLTEGAQSPLVVQFLAPILTALVSNASHVAKLFKLWLPGAKFDRANNGTFVELKPFQDEVFAGRVDKLVAFVVQCMRAEHTCFLGGANVLGTLLLELLGTPSDSPTASTG